MNKKIKKKTCREFYELRDGDSRPENIITVTADKRKNMKGKLSVVFLPHSLYREKPGPDLILHQIYLIVFKTGAEHCQ